MGWLLFDPKVGGSIPFMLHASFRRVHSDRDTFWRILFDELISSKSKGPDKLCCVCPMSGSSIAHCTNLELSGVVEGLIKIRSPYTTSLVFLQ